MFPYPSGDLHMGHAEAYALGDAMARYYTLRGHNVLHPIGWDAFGLPAENAAIRNNTHPADWTYKNIEIQAASFRQYAVSFDWSRRLQTCDPEYYRWTQWLFLRFYERGLAYRADGYVNWCPVDQTVLANEQVIDGKCERCGSEVIRRVLTQWYFKITEYADRLLADMEPLEGKWPERVLLMQRNWIGRSEGAEVSFEIEGRDEPVTVFTTRPDTLYGATFFVVAADSPLAAELCAPERAGRAGRLPGRRPEADRHRAPVDRPGEDRRVPGPVRDQPGERRARFRSGPPTTCCPTTAPARSWRCPRTTSATWTSPGSSGCRSGSCWTPAGLTRPRPAWPRPARARWSTPGRWTGCRSRRRSPGSSRSWPSAGWAVAR